MARIKDSTVEAVRERADIVAIVEERTPLRKAGSRFVGRCPFHEERTPSFSVSPSAGFYHCFGCGAGGDTIKFVRETQNLDFVEAVEWLAQRSGIEVEYEDAAPGDDERRRRRERLYALLEHATVFYERYLWEAQASAGAREYLAGRGLREPVCREFRLGLAPAGSTLSTKARERGFTPEELRAAGLVRQRGGDYFQRRLLFPLADPRGRVVGFQARRLHDDDPLAAKYVNTPESELFRKGSLLYGLDRAKAAIAKQDRACVVEGNTDVIALRQAGFEPVVASMGTALTEQQLRELGRMTQRLWLAFDGDAAGEAATLRGMELAASQGFDVKVVGLEPGVDPADDPADFEARLARAEPYLRHRVRVENERAGDREAAFRAIREVLERAPDSPERREAWRLANDLLDMTVQIRAAGGGTASAGAAASPRLLQAADRLERNALASVVGFRSLLPVLAELPPEHFRDPVNRAVRGYLVEGTRLDDAGIERLAELDARVEAEGIDKETGEELLLRLRERELVSELQRAPDLERAKELQEQLRRVQEAIDGVRRQTPVHE